MVVRKIKNNYFLVFAFMIYICISLILVLSFIYKPNYAIHFTGGNFFYVPAQNYNSCLILEIDNRGKYHQKLIKDHKILKDLYGKYYKSNGNLVFEKFLNPNFDQIMSYSLENKKNSFLLYKSLSGIYEIKTYELYNPYKIISIDNIDEMCKINK